jgi:multiple antibiotic resistance protein
MNSIITVSLVLFSVIDSVGTLPYIIQLKKQEGELKKLKITMIAGGLMVSFFLFGEGILKMIGLDIASFALAGGALMFLSAAEMILGINFSKEEKGIASTRSIVPLVFPMLAGAGTLTTLISLRAVYNEYVILIGIAINIFILYLVLNSAGWIEKKMGTASLGLIKKVFGIIVLAMAFKIFKTGFDSNF